MLEYELDVAIRGIREASALLLLEADRPGGPRGSGQHAEVDLEIEALLCRTLSTAFPDDSLVAEEGTRSYGRSGRAFHIDPHDGTADFLRGIRESSISIGLVDNGEVVMGVVIAPFGSQATGPESVLAAWARGNPLKSNRTNIREAPEPTSLSGNCLVLVSRNLNPNALKENQRLLSPARVHQCSSIATRLALVAVGSADLTLTVNQPLNSWDFAGGQALLSGSGGQLVGPEGRPIRWVETDVHPEDQNLTGYFGSRSPDLAIQAARLYAGLTQRVLPLTGDIN